MSKLVHVKRSTRVRWCACLCALLTVAMALAVSGVAASWDAVWEQAKLTASDGAATDCFGYSVAVFEDTIVVGAYLDDDLGSRSGSAYVFARNQGGLGNWGQVTKLTASDGAAGDRFGVSVDMDGDAIVVGAYWDDDQGTDSGSAYVFYRHQGGTDNWGQVAKLTPSDSAADDYFGVSVAVAGDTIVVGAHGDDDQGADSGSAYVFQRHQGGMDNWGQVAKLMASDGATEDYFGTPVDVDGDTIVVGACWDDDQGSASGSAYVFYRHQGGMDNWGQVKKLMASDGADNDRFGRSVAVAADTIAVGAFLDDDKGSASGSAYVFYRHQGGADNWGQVAKLTASDGAGGARFGVSAEIDGDAMVIGAYRDDDKGLDSGSAYVFDRHQGGTDNWGQVAKLTASDGAEGDRFGLSVGVSGETIVAGAYWDDDMGSESGSAYVYVQDSDGDGIPDSDEPQAVKQGVIAGLAGLLPTGNRETDQRMEKAIASLEKSLDAALWETDSTLTTKGSQVFDEEKKAVHELMKVLEHKNADEASAGSAQAAVADIVNADETLALVATDEAAALAEEAGCSEESADLDCRKMLKELAQAQEELGKAQQELEQGNPDKSVEHYRKAWFRAQKAMNRLPDGSE